MIHSYLSLILTTFTASQWSCGKVMFSVVSINQSVCLFIERAHVTVNLFKLVHLGTRPLALVLLPKLMKADGWPSTQQPSSVHCNQNFKPFLPCNCTFKSLLVKCIIGAFLRFMNSLRNDIFLIPNCLTLIIN